MAKRKRKGYDWKPATHRWVKDKRNKWLTSSSFWNPKKKKLTKSILEESENMSISPLDSLTQFLEKQSPEVASRMAARGLIWSPERHRWIKKPDVATEAVLPESPYAQQEFGNIAPPVEPKTVPIPSAANTRATGLQTLEGFKSKLSDWEKEFFSSVKQQFEKKGSLSDKQWAIVEKMVDKYTKQADIDSGKVEAAPLPPSFKKLDKLKKFMPEKHIQAIESMERQVKAGSTLSSKQEDYLEIIENNAEKQKKGLTEPATGNIIVRPPYEIDLHAGWRKNNIASIRSLLDVSGKGAFHPQGRKWLEDNGFKWGGPMSGKFYKPLSNTEKIEWVKEITSEVNSIVNKEDDPEKWTELFIDLQDKSVKKRVNDLMDSMPALRDMGFTLKRPKPSEKPGDMSDYRTPKVWKMLLGIKK